MTYTNYILDDDNNPVAKPTTVVSQWCVENPNRLRVGDTTINRDGHDIHISTVFLRGIDHRWRGADGMGDGPPVLWETMVFWRGEDVTERYETYDEAVAGHERYVASVRAPEEINAMGGGPAPQSNASLFVGPIDPPLSVKAGEVRGITDSSGAVVPLADRQGEHG